MLNTKRENFYSKNNGKNRNNQNRNNGNNRNENNENENNVVTETVQLISENNANNNFDFANTSDFVVYSRNSEKLMDMFKSLEEAEKKCAELEEIQYSKEQKNNIRENDRTFKELEEQDKKINELKEIVKYLTIEKKRRDKINNRCRNNNQNKLNKQYDIVRKLNKEGLVKDNSINLDLNLSNSELLKNLLNKSDNKQQKKCRTKGSDFINVDTGKIGKCSGCDVEKLKEQEPYILKDFS